MNATQTKGDNKMINARFINELFPMIDSDSITATEAAQFVLDKGWDLKSFSPQGNAEMAYWDILDAYKNIKASEKPAAPDAASTNLVTCSCGCEVPRAFVMNSSMGTSCPDCYDRMSD